MFFSVDVFHYGSDFSFSVRECNDVFECVFVEFFVLDEKMTKQVQHSAAFGITVENVCAKQTWEILKCIKSTSTNFYRLEKKSQYQKMLGTPNQGAVPTSAILRVVQ